MFKKIAHTGKTLLASIPAREWTRRIARAWKTLLTRLSARKPSHHGLGLALHLLMTCTELFGASGTATHTLGIIAALTLYWLARGGRGT